MRQNDQISYAKTVYGQEEIDHFVSLYNFSCYNSLTFKNNLSNLLVN